MAAKSTKPASKENKLKVNEKVKDAKRAKMHINKETNMKKGINQGLKRYEDEHFVDSTKPVWNYSLFNEEVIRNFQQGTCYNAYEYFGNKQLSVLDTPGTYFAVWAPNATMVTVTGNFNDWNKSSHELFVRLDKSGIWEGFIPHLNRGEVYKYHITGFGGVKLDKGDPYAHYWELKPLTASITWNFEFEWNDQE